MQIDVSKATSGMTLQKDVIGKTGKPLIEKNTVLTDEHIEFLEKFLIKTIEVSPLLDFVNTPIEDKRVNISLKEETRNKYQASYRLAVNEYKKAFHAWKRDNPIEMTDVNNIGLALFRDMPNQEFTTIIELMNDSSPDDVFYEKVVATSVLSIYIAMKLGFLKKEWIQIGYAGLLMDSGMIHYDERIMKGEGLTTPEIERMQIHPVYSYKLVEPLTTLTQFAKLGILQHHELMDGSGYPGKVGLEKIHPYARILMVSEYFYLSYYRHRDLKEVIKQLQNKRESKFSEIVVDELLKHLKKVVV